MPNVLLQRADGTAKVRKLSGRFTPIMIDSDAGAIRTYRLVEAGSDDQGQFYVYVEDETLRLPVTHPSEVEANAGEEDGGGNPGGESTQPEKDAGAGSGDRDAT